MIPMTAAFQLQLKKISRLEQEARIQLPPFINDGDLNFRRRVFNDNFFLNDQDIWRDPDPIQIAHMADLFKNHLAVGLYPDGAFITLLRMYIGADANDQIVVVYQPIACPVDNPGTGGRNFMLPGTNGQPYPGSLEYYVYDGPNGFQPADIGMVSTLLINYTSRMRSYKTRTDGPPAPPTAFIPDISGAEGDTSYVMFPFQEIFGVSPRIDINGPIADLLQGTIMVYNGASLYPTGHIDRYKHNFVLVVQQTDGGANYISNIDLTSMCPPGRYSVSYTVQ